MGAIGSSRARSASSVSASPGSAVPAHAAAIFCLGRGRSSARCRVLAGGHPAWDSPPRAVRLDLLARAGCALGPAGRGNRVGQRAWLTRSRGACARRGLILYRGGRECGAARPPWWVATRAQAARGQHHDGGDPVADVSATNRRAPCAGGWAEVHRAARPAKEGGAQGARRAGAVPLVLGVRRGQEDARRPVADASTSRVDEMPTVPNQPVGSIARSTRASQNADIEQANGPVPRSGRAPAASHRAHHRGVPSSCETRGLPRLARGARGDVSLGDGRPAWRRPQAWPGGSWWGAAQTKTT